MNDVGGLMLATLAFVGTHLAMSHPLRLRLVGALGEVSFTLLYSVVAFLTLGWMVVAWMWSGGGAAVPYWSAPGWAWWVGSAVMLIALILLIGSLFGNPALPRPGAPRRRIGPATGVFAITRHPMNWSFMLWAAVHIALYGSPRNLVVAGGILILAVAGSVGQDRKKEAAIGETWRDWESRTSFVPFVALLRGRASWRVAAPGWKPVLIGFALWLAIGWFHAPTVSPVAMLLNR